MVFPLTVIALAVAVMIGDGYCAFVSLSLGKSRTADAKKSVGNAVVMTVASGVALGTVYLLFADKLIAAALTAGTYKELGREERPRVQPSARVLSKA